MKRFPNGFRKWEAAQTYFPGLMFDDLRTWREREEPGCYSTLCFVTKVFYL